ncbi:MAG TPA: gluconate 2-dehydrogenase subunit 3 family protein [Terriglobales bacterium]|nr:gluconate 2-dehydrogenase subunit 3 family protein [Terriglobales bacterium]
MAGQDFQRREILRVMAMAAVASHFPGFSKWAFAAAHPGASGTQIRPAKYSPLFFNEQEYALVEKLTDLIIPSDDTPGARDAGVAEFVDFMIAHDSARQYSFRTGLTWLNAHSEKLSGKPFLELSTEQQQSVLEPLAYKAKFRPGEEDGQQFLAKMREITAQGFYTTEIGYKELDNPALRLYAESPACPHKDDSEHKHLPAPIW